MLVLAMLGAAIAAPAYTQTAGASAASAQGKPPELRVAAFLAPPSVMEQNGTLTGFSVDLWNAIATR
jgi:polar amino acid transport system substrate-binding protein